MRRYPHRSLSLLAILFLFLPAGLTDSIGQSDGRPNVIVFLVDDMGWMDSGVYGSRYYETPNIDALAQRGMLFTDAYAANPLCSPTRASILTGKYPARLRFTTAAGHTPPQPQDAQPYPEKVSPGTRLIQPRTIRHLPLEEITVAEVFREAGYATGHFGKWHLGLNPEHWPDQQGFEVKFHGAPDPGPPSYHSPYNFKAGNVTDGPEGEYITDRLTGEALKFIEANRDQPFLLHLWQYGVHGPWGHKEELTKKFAEKKDPRGRQDNPIMASMLKSVDESLGRVVAKLEELEIGQNTIIIFSSDNGGNVHSNIESDKRRNVPPSHPKYEQVADYRQWAGFKAPTNNFPLRKGKAYLYEGGIRVPLIVVWPDTVAPGTRNGTPVSTIDFYPTMLEMAGISKPDEQQLDGLSLVSLLTGEEQWEREALFNFFPGGGPQKPGGITVREGDWKLIRWYETGPDYPDLLELYNLREDIGETTNLAGKHPEKVTHLENLLKEFVARTGACEPKPNPEFDPDFRNRQSSAVNKADDGLQGWVPKLIQATPTDSGLTLEADGKQPFIANVRFARKIETPGPYQLVVRFKEPVTGSGKMQWRSADQETFPETGQLKPFEMENEESLSVSLPVDGKISHLRFFPPVAGGPVTIQSIRLLSIEGAREKPLAAWNFKKR